MASHTFTRVRTQGFDFKTCTKTGYLEKRGEHNTMYKRRFFALKGKGLYYFKEKDDLEEAGMIDLRTIADIVSGTIVESSTPRTTPVKRSPKAEAIVGPPSPGLPEEFCLLAPGRSYQLKAASQEEAAGWMAALRNTQVFGVPLASSSSLVPLVVEKCCDFVESNGIFTEGIYRIPGNAAVIKQIKQSFNMDDDAVQLTVDKFTVHDVGGVLKLFFRELPDPLIPSSLYQKFIAASAITDHNSSLYSLQTAIKEMPFHNYETLKRMCVHLARISEHSETNKMTIRNVCIVFGPTLMQVDAHNTGDSQQVATQNFANMGGEYKCVSDLVTYYEWLFDMEAKSEQQLIFEEGLRKMEQARMDQARMEKEKQAVTSVPFILEIFYDDSSISHTLPITSKMTGKDVVNLMVSKGKYEESPLWSIVEELKGRNLKRAIEDHESVIESTGTWKCHGELRMQMNPSKPLVFSAVRVGWGERQCVCVCVWVCVWVCVCVCDRERERVKSELCTFQLYTHFTISPTPCAENHGWVAVHQEEHDKICARHGCQVH
jgi:Arf-GAP/Rho-GAP domain/ANK repeat/PH domain-containing protein 1